MTATVEIALLPNQYEFVSDTARFSAYIGGIGSGKTYAGAVKVLQRLRQPGYGLIAAPTYPMLRDSTQRTLLDLMETTPLKFDWHKSDNTITIPASGHTILCRSLDNPETMRGPNLDYAWIDEAAMVSDMAWRIVKGRVRAGTNPQAWITTTPKGRNWIYQEFVAEPDSNHDLYRTATYENKHLPADFADSLGYTGEFYAQEIAGEFVNFEGLIYQEFSRDRVQRVDCTGWRTLLGIDVGARNPTAVLVVRLAGDGRIHIESERYQRDLDSDEITDLIIATILLTDAERAYADPSAKAYIDSWQKRNLRVKPANNDVTRGIQIVKAALADGLTVDPSCVNLISEFESYRWSDGEKDQPVKQNDHALDALRYALVGEAAPKVSVRIV